MKKLLLIIALMASPAMACTSTAEFAAGVMKHRQYIGDITQIVEVCEGIESEGEKKLCYIIMDEAYKKARYSGDEYRQKAIVDFKTLFYMACMQNKS